MDEGLRLSIYEVTIGATQTHLGITVYVVADSIDDALRGINDFRDKYPWRDEKPDVNSIKLVHTPDYVIVSAKYAYDRGEAM